MNPIEELIDSYGREAFVKDIVATLQKADAFTGGVNGQQIVWYNLDPTVKFLYPYEEEAPLILGNAAKGIAPIPTVESKGGSAAHWKTITKIDDNNVAGGVGRGQRAGAMVLDGNDLSSQFFGVGVEVPVDFETRYEAGQLVPEVLSIAHQSGLRALMRMREKLVIGGNNTVALGTGPTPTVVDGASSGGTMSQGGGTLSVKIVALTNDGLLRSSVAGGVQGQIIRQNMDGSTLTFGAGSSNVSAAGTLSLTASHTALATWAAVSGAVAYAVYWGASGAEKLGAIVTITGIELKADATGTQLATAITADNSKNAYVYDGIISQMAGTTFGSASNSYLATQANGSGAGTAAGTVGSGNGLTADGAGGIVEFDTLLKNRWDNFRIGFPNGYILMNSQEVGNITKKILVSPSGTTSLFRTSQNYGPDGRLMGGFRLEAYHNKYTNEDIDIKVHPWVPAGTIIFWSTKIPYPMSNVSQIMRFEQRQGFIAIDWPLSTRQYQTGFYVDESFQTFFTPGFAMIQNVGNN